MKSVYSSKLVLISLFVFSLFIIISPTNPVKALNGCGCDDKSAGGSGLCEMGDCYPSIKTVACGSSSEICDRAQARYACENAEMYTSFYLADPNAIINKFLCPYNDGAYTDFAINADKGSYSEVFRRCYCTTGDIIQQVLNIAVYSISIIALFLLVVGGIKYMTAQNNPDKITEAKEMLIAAILGMILVLFSVTLLRLLNAQLNPDWGIDLLNIP